MKPVPEHIERELAQWKTQNAYRKLQIKPGLVDFSSNDYLGLARESGLDVEKIRDLSLGSTGSRLLTGHREIHAEVEALGAELFRGESALLFNSGYLANLGVLSALPGRHDVIHYDAAVHASIKDGMRLSFAKKRSFPHQDLAALEQNLKTGNGNQFVVVEALYSMDGDLAPLPDLAAICARNEAYLIVDEAHSTGLLGPEGAGWAVETNTHTSTWLRIHTFGKAPGRQGAMIMGPQKIREYLINRARPFIYTTAMSPLMAGALKSGLERLKTPEVAQHREKLLQLRQQLGTALGLPPSPGPIVPWKIPGNEAVKAFSTQLETAGFDVRPILAPTVPEGQERLRIVLHSFNTAEQVEKLADLLKNHS